jgi:DNA replication and repair protein RecF
MAKNAAYIASKRADYVKGLSEHVGKIISDMTQGREKCALTYEGGADEAEYLKKLSVNLEKEKAAKTTLYGVHKDDVAVTLNGLDSRVYASQGQQRSIALAMKISEGEISREKTGEYPVFLFDDILSELDEKRKDFILAGLDNRQVIITGCEDINKGKIFIIKNGSVCS